MPGNYPPIALSPEGKCYPCPFGPVGPKGPPGPAGAAVMLLSNSETSEKIFNNFIRVLEVDPASRVARVEKVTSDLQVMLGQQVLRAKLVVPDRKETTAKTEPEAARDQLVAKVITVELDPRVLPAQPDLKEIVLVVPEKRDHQDLVVKMECLVRKAHQVQLANLAILVKMPHTVLAPEEFSPTKIKKQLLVIRFKNFMFNFNFAFLIYAIHIVKLFIHNYSNTCLSLVN